MPVNTDEDSSFCASRVTASAIDDAVDAGKQWGIQPPAICAWRTRDADQSNKRFMRPTDYRAARPPIVAAVAPATKPRRQPSSPGCAWTPDKSHARACPATGDRAAAEPARPQRCAHDTRAIATRRFHCRPTARPATAANDCNASTRAHRGRDGGSLRAREAQLAVAGNTVDVNERTGSQRSGRRRCSRSREVLLRSKRCGIVRLTICVTCWLSGWWGRCRSCGQRWEIFVSGVRLC